MRRIVFLFLFLFIEQNSAIFSDEENALLPRLFHLDDQERCLLQKSGLYCLGEFDLGPIGSSLMYENIKKYSNDAAAYNRSRLYRGYCVSERCPLRTTNNTTEDNAAQRFEQCVQQRVRRHALTARLHTLKYCTTHQQHMQKMIQPPDAAQQLFLRVVLAILTLNIFGTFYDIFTTNKQKNGAITAWSVRASWRRLTAVYDDGDPRLKQLEPIQGMRVVAMLLTIYTHIWVTEYQFYVTNPHALEILFKRLDGIILPNGMSLIQGFVMISSFLTAYNLLIYSENHKLNLLMLPVLLMKRIIRIAPVHLLMVGFSATYWPSTRTGAASAIISEMSAICREKFWLHVWFLNNIVDNKHLCLPPAWYLAVDMHLFIVSCALTIVMLRRRLLALRLYVILLVLSSAYSGVIAYINGWQVAAAIALPETIRGVFVKAPSFSEYYISTYGSLPACMLGLFLAHLHYDLQQKKYDWNQNQWIKRLIPWLIPAMVLYTYLMGVTLDMYKQPWVRALCVALDRPLFTSLYIILLIGMINIDVVLTRFFGWHGWRVPARLSLPMMLCHWTVGIIIAARPVAYYTSVFNVTIDYFGTLFYGYLMSISVALLVEIPVQRFFAQLF